MNDEMVEVVTQKPNGQLEIVEHRGVQALFTEGTATSMKQWPTNLDFGDPRERMLAFNSLNPADVKLSAEKAIRFLAHRFILVPEEREDEETGEVREFATLVLFDHKGQTLKTSSAWAWRKAKAAFELYSKSDWDLGIPFKIQVRLSERKRPYHDIRIEMSK